jgi:hypothetical protein
MKITKILAGSLAALAAGATMTAGIFAAGLGDYVSDSKLPLIVIGSPTSLSPGYAKDVIGAADIAAAVAGYATTTVSTGGVSATTSITGGADLATQSDKLYMTSVINKAKTTLTASDLPDVLKSGEVSSTSGTIYKYDQYLTVGSKSITFGNSNGDLTDPAVILDIGYDRDSPLYNTTVVFSKALNVSSSTVQTREMELFGQKYTIGANSQTTSSPFVLELFGSGVTKQLQEGADAYEFTDDSGNPHSAKVNYVYQGSGSVNKVSIDIDGTTSEFTEGSSGKIGDVNIYVKSIAYFSGTTKPGWAEVSLGSSKLTLTDGQKVRLGEDIYVEGTRVFLTGDTSGISTLTIEVAGATSASDYIAADGEFTDPVFKTFKMAFNGLTPALMDSSRDTIVIDDSGNLQASVKLTDYRGNERTFIWIVSGTSWGPALNSTTTREYHVLEGENVARGDYFLYAPSVESDFGHIYELTQVSSVGSATAAVQITDAFSLDVKTIYLTDSGFGTKKFYVDGQTVYAVNATSTAESNMKFYYGSSASASSAGDKLTVFPLIRLNGGEYFTFVKNNTMSVAVAGGATKTFETPSGDLAVIVDSEVGNFTLGGTINSTSPMDVTLAGLVYTVAYTSTGNQVTVTRIGLDDAYFDTTNNPNQYGVLVKQEKDNSTTKDFVLFGISKGSGSTTEIAISQPQITGAYSYASLTSDPSVIQFVNAFGSTIAYDSDNRGINTFYYPNDQAVATVAVGSDPSFSTATGTGGTVEQAVKIQNPVAKLANEVTTTSLTSDLILVGGPCANSLVADLLSDSEQCSNWPYTTGSPAGIIKEVSDAFGSGKKALIVAGNLPEDTRALAAKVMKGTTSYQSS